MAKTTTKKQFHGGIFDGLRVPDRDEDKLWVTIYELNGKQWDAPNGVFYKNFPAGVIRHAYRKQKNGQFQYVWSKPNSD